MSFAAAFFALTGWLIAAALLRLRQRAEREADDYLAVALHYKHQRDALRYLNNALLRAQRPGAMEGLAPVAEFEAGADGWEMHTDVSLN